MELGTVLHAYVANLLKTAQPDHSAPFPPGVGFEALMEAADRYLLPIPWIIHGIEEPLSVPLGHGFQSQHHLIGRLDARISDPATASSAQKSLQIKTFGRGRSLGPFLEQTRMSPHEIAYRTMMRHSGHECDGTLLLLFRTYLTAQQQADDVPLYESFDLQATPEEDAAAFLHLRRQALQLISYLEDSTLSPLKNWSACFSLIGNCPLLPHCHDGSDIGACLPVPLVNRYADLSPDPPPPALLNS